MRKALAVLAAAIVLTGCSFSTKSLPKTGVDLNGDLLVVYDGRMGSDYTFVGQSNVAEQDVFVDERGDGYAGRRFKPESAGECTMIFRIKSISQDVIEMKVFDITVDDKMVLTYTERDTTPYPLKNWIKSSDYDITVTHNGAMEMGTSSNALVIANEAEMLFGTSQSTTEQEVRDSIDDMTCFEMSYGDQDGKRHQRMMWIGRDGSAFSYEEKVNGDEEWLSWTADKECSCDRLFGQIDMLIQDAGMFKTPFN